MISSIARDWDALGPFQAQVIAFVLTTLGCICTYLFRGKVKFWGRANNSFHVLKTGEQQTKNVYCEMLYVQNVWRKSADNVEAVLTGVPSEISLYERKIIENSRLLIAQPFIASRELVITSIVQLLKFFQYVVQTLSVSALNGGFYKNSERSIISLSCFFMGLGIFLAVRF